MPINRLVRAPIYMSWLQSTVRCSGRCYCCIDERIAVGAGTAFGDVVVATKVSPGPENLDSIEQVITTQIDEGLKWLGRDHVDVIYLYHAVLNERQPERGRLAVEDGGARQRRVCRRRSMRARRGAGGSTALAIPKR